MMKSRIRSPFRTMVSSNVLLRFVSPMVLCLLGCSGQDATGPDVSMQNGSIGPTEKKTQTESIDTTGVDRAEAEPLFPFACQASKSPMFAEEAVDGGSSEVLTMRIDADFTNVNGAPTKEASRTGATITLGEEGLQLTSDIIARGQSRFHNCGARPFSLKFAEKQKGEGNPFKGLGKTINFVTHCDCKPGSLVTCPQASMADYEQRVVMEHTVYQILDRLDVPSLKTRLTRITYHDTKTNEEETHLAFVREPEDTMAARCGAAEPETAIDMQLPTNEHAMLLLHLLQGFVIQTDYRLNSPGRNVIRLNDLARTQLFYAPYDFDLVGIFRPEYAGRELATNADLFRDWLRRNQSPTLFREIDRILERDPERNVDRPAQMRAAIDQPLLREDNRRIFSNWLELYLGILEEFRGCEGRSQDPAQPLCYVEDDHGDRSDSATVMDSVVQKIRVEPPGDVDMFSLSVQAGGLYTMGSDINVALELLDDQGNVLAKSGEQTIVSHRVARGGTAYVRASLGQRLVAFPPYEPPDRSLFVYADDHGASLENATRLQVGKAVQGQWELPLSSGVMDQDWFLFTADTVPSLHVIVASAEANARAELWTNVLFPEFADQALVEGDNDLSGLFEGLSTGEYILSLAGTESSYTVELRP